MTRAIIMSEPPAKCNFACEYCYVPPNFERRLDEKQVTSQDFLKLAEKTGADSYLFWMCGIGEPFMMPYFEEVMTTLSREHKICAVTNLSYFGNDTPEKLIEINPKNVGMYWSVHWNEMKKHRVLGKTLERVKKLTEGGIHVWPTIVLHPSYFDSLDEVLESMGELGLKISFCRYRIGQENLAGLAEEKMLMGKYKDDPRVDWKIWNITPECWNVAGGRCHAGKKQIIVDAWWRICTCHGDKNATFFGTFPEDLDKVQLKEVGVCRSSKCQCKHSVFWGVNEKYPHTFADILEDWEGFINA